MTAIRLDADSVSRIRGSQGAVLLCDERGSPVRMCVLSPIPEAEPELPNEEWEKIAKAPGGMTTPQLIEFLNGLGRP